MLKFIIIIAVLYIVAWYINHKRNLDKNSNKENNVRIDLTKSPFLIANSLLTKAEMNFYNVLNNCLDDNKTIFIKVRMLDVLWTKTYHVDNKTSYLNKVNRKHFDYVITDKETLKPLMAIELDDKSHEEEDRKERDEFVDALFLSLKFPVIHIKVGYTYDVESIKEQINSSINRTEVEIDKA